MYIIEKLQNIVEILHNKIQRNLEMEKTTDEMVLDHKGLKEVVFAFLHNGVRKERRLICKKDANLNKVGIEYADGIEYGDRQMDKLFGIRLKRSCMFLGIVRA